MNYNIHNEQNQTPATISNLKTMYNNNPNIQKEINTSIINNSNNTSNLYNKTTTSLPTPRVYNKEQNPGKTQNFQYQPNQNNPYNMKVKIPAEHKDENFGLFKNSNISNKVNYDKYSNKLIPAEIFTNLNTVDQIIKDNTGQKDIINNNINRQQNNFPKTTKNNPNFNNKIFENNKIPKNKNEDIENNNYNIKNTPEKPKSNIKFNNFKPNNIYKSTSNIYNNLNNSASLSQNNFNKIKNSDNKQINNSMKKPNKSNDINEKNDSFCNNQNNNNSSVDKMVDVRKHLNNYYQTKQVDNKNNYFKEFMTTHEDTSGQGILNENNSNKNSDLEIIQKFDYKNFKEKVLNDYNRSKNTYKQNQLNCIDELEVDKNTKPEINQKNYNFRKDIIYSNPENKKDENLENNLEEKNDFNDFRRGIYENKNGKQNYKENNIQNNIYNRNSNNPINPPALDRINTNFNFERPSLANKNKRESFEDVSNLNNREKDLNSIMSYMNNLNNNNEKDIIKINNNIEYNNERLKLNEINKNFVMSKIEVKNHRSNSHTDDR